MKPIRLEGANAADLRPCLPMGSRRCSRSNPSPPDAALPVRRLASAIARVMTIIVGRGNLASRFNTTADGYAVSGCSIAEEDTGYFRAALGLWG